MTKGPDPRHPLDRFVEKVDFDGPLPPCDPSLGPCWLWSAALKGYGYGQFGPRAGVTRSAHRWIYEELVADPGDLHLDHLCRTPACVNPDHLEPVTPRENALRGEGFVGREARQTHCLRGHEFTPANTYRWGPAPNQRKCRACGAARKAAARRKANGA